MKLAAHAGIAIPATSTLGSSAWAADPTAEGRDDRRDAGKRLLGSLHQGLQGDGGVAQSSIPQDLYHDNDAARELAQVRGLPTSGVNMLINTVVAAGEVPMVAKICQENKIFYAALWEIPAWFTPPDVGDFFVTYSTAELDSGGLRGREGTVQVDRRRRRRRARQGPSRRRQTTRARPGVLKAAKEFPGIKIVGDLRGDWVREKARTVMLSMVTAHPDMKAVFAQNDFDGARRPQRVEGTRPDECEVGRHRRHSGGAAGGREGRPVCRDQHVAAALSGGLPAVLLFDCLRGYKPKLPERLLYTGAVTATAANAASIA